WFPETGSEDADGNVVGTDFYTHTTGLATVIKTDDAMGLLHWPGHESLVVADPSVTPAGFTGIAGMGRAIKFTFTLYDSRGFFRDGRTFTHIVYLGDIE
ncbi:MAG TPA: hypothetical protein VLH60_01615, partial [Sedimentisphaerales bacterium]|nr:hypothetical protein [Sedimentisphaerales bacterium]